MESLIKELFRKWGQDVENLLGVMQNPGTGNCQYSTYPNLEKVIS